MGKVVIQRVEKFKHLGSIIEGKGDIDKDINHRIKVGWQKWWSSSKVLCDKKILVRLKGKVYHMTVRAALMYEAECWPIQKTQIQRLMVADIRMIQWMCSFIRLDRIRNEVIKEKVKVAPVEDKMRQTRLRWFGHVKKRSVHAPVRRCEHINLMHCKRGRGRLKMSWNVVIRRNLNFMGFTEDMAQDRDIWRSRIKITDHR